MSKRSNKSALHFSTTYLRLTLSPSISPSNGLQGSRDVRCLPLVRRGELHRWIRIYIASCPDKFWERLNGVFQKLPTLIDPMTDAPFTERIIPRSCFPETRVPEAVDFLLAAVENFNKKRTQILDKIEEYRLPPKQQQQQPQNLAHAQADYRAAVEEARFVRESARDALGGWRTDENGNRLMLRGINFELTFMSLS
jgi:hypothetical protein